MFTSKQIRNFAYGKSVYCVFRDYIFEETHANSVQISFSILEFSPKKSVAYPKLNFVRSRMNAKDFSLKCRQIIYCVTTDFAEKLLVTQLCISISAIMYSAAISAIMYSAATSSAQNVMH